MPKCDICKHDHEPWQSHVFGDGRRQKPVQNTEPRRQEPVYSPDDLDKRIDALGAELRELKAERRRLYKSEWARKRRGSTNT